MHRSVARGVALILAAVAIIVVMFFLPGPRPEHNDHRASLDPWVLVSEHPDNKYGTYLANGFISTRIKGDGVGSQNGKPLPCFMAGLYVDEKLIPTPTWSDLRFYDGKTEFKIDEHEPYSQRLLMKSGILVTTATWRAGGRTLHGSIEIFVSRAQPNVALILAALVANFDGKIRVEAPLGNIDKTLKLASVDYTTPDGFREPVLTATFRAGSDWGATSIAIASRLSSEAETAHGTDRAKLTQYIDIGAKHDYKFMLTSYVSLATGAHPSPAAQAALAELKSAVDLKTDFRKQHEQAWEKLWEKDITIDGPKRDQQAIHSCMFYLLQSVREGSQWSLPPMGLSDNAFGGHVFWDADTWMFPALIMQHPELARSIVDYRFNTLPGAIANAKADGYAGAQYAWESGATGKEDTPTGLVYRHARHINGDVALAQWQYYLATGDLNWLKERGYPVIKATADYWLTRATFNHNEDRYEILQVVPPDENAELVDNSVYTNAIAKLNLQIAARAAQLVGERPSPEWVETAAKMYIPFARAKKYRFIAFDGYKGFKAKQADTELLIYPLQFKYGNEDVTQIYKNTFSFYSPKVMPNGPAMTSSAHSIIAARLGDRRKAYTAFVESYKPYLRGQFNYFNEKRSETYENMCFLTGAAGPIQSAIFGLAGIRMDYFPENPRAVDLHYAPCLPEQWKSLRITGVQWRGQTFDVLISPGDKVELANVRTLQ